MKRKGYLYEQIISVENLMLADEKARKNKKNTYGVRIHDKNREENILMLHKQLKDKTYKTSPYTTFKITEPKERIIYRLPYYPDRIVHHAVVNVVGDLWSSVFTKDTYSCIKGRGIHGVLRQMKWDLKDVENTKYCLKIDVKKYFPNINHDVLKSIIRKKIKDKDLLWLLDEIIDSTDGLPIGNYLSQYFANLYLGYFDHHVKEVLKVKFYYRYTDDMVFLSKDKAQLHELLYIIKDKIGNECKLELKYNYQVFPTDKRGIDYVGYRFYSDHVLMRKSIKQNLCRKVIKSNKRTDLTKDEFRQQICSWLGWAKHCNAKNLLTKLNIESI